MIATQSNRDRAFLLHPRLAATLALLMLFQYGRSPAQQAMFESMQGLTNPIDWPRFWAIEFGVAETAVFVAVLMIWLPAVWSSPSRTLRVAIVAGVFLIIDWGGLRDLRSVSNEIASPWLAWFVAVSLPLYLPIGLVVLACACLPTPGNSRDVGGISFYLAPVQQLGPPMPKRLTGPCPPNPRLVASVLLVPIAGILASFANWLYWYMGGRGRASSRVVQSTFDLLMEVLPAITIFVGLILIWRSTFYWTPRLRSHFRAITLGWLTVLVFAILITSDLMIPHWSATGISYLATAIAVVLVSVAGWRSQLLYFDNSAPCPRCGYDLRGQRECRCPECGWEFSLGDFVQSVYSEPNPRK